MKLSLTKKPHNSSFGCQENDEEEIQKSISQFDISKVGMSSKNRTLRICKHQTKSSPKENKLRERERERGTIAV